jgi:hypothetical protein
MNEGQSDLQSLFASLEAESLVSENEVENLEPRFL